MNQRISHLLNLNQQRFIAMGGIPGAGKSTVVSEFENIGYEVVCPDRIRVELAQKLPGNELKLEGELVDILQNFSPEAWKIAAEKTKDLLKIGKSVIFDATFTTIKARKQILSWANETNMQLTAIYVECPLELALERNAKRSQHVTGINSNGEEVLGRGVPNFVIESKWRTQVLPTINEGFHEIIILHQGLNEKEIDVKSVIEELKTSDSLIDKIKAFNDNGTLKQVFPTLAKCWNVDQENHHHAFPLHQHMIKAAEYLQNECTELFIAGLLHDVGKIPTKGKYGKLLINTIQFKIGDKVQLFNVPEIKGFLIAKKLTPFGERSELLTIKHFDIDTNAHYYEHELVGAILARRELIEAGYDDDFAQRVYEYVLYHMEMPYQQVSKNAMRNLISRVGKENIDSVIKLREADKAGSGESGDEYLTTIHPYNINLIQELLNQE